MTWHMVERYGQSDPPAFLVECLRREADRAFACVDATHPVLKDRVDALLAMLSRVAATSYLLRSGCPPGEYRVFRDAVRLHAGQLDQVRAECVVSQLLPQLLAVPSVPRQKDLRCALATGDWIADAVPRLLAGLTPPPPASIDAALERLSDYPERFRVVADTPADQLSASALAKIVRKARRMSALLELLRPGLPEPWERFRTLHVRCLDVLEGLVEIRCLTRLIRHPAPAGVKRGLRRLARQQRAQMLDNMAALQSRPAVSLTINWSQVLQEHSIAAD